MKITVLLLIGTLELLLPGLASAGLAGYWEGTFVRLGAVQQVSFDFRQTDTGWYGTYSIPDLILYREPIRDIALNGDTVNFQVFWGGFSCIIHDEFGEITGENPDWNPPVSVHLKRALNPHHISIEHVQFRSDSLMLAGDLLIPAGNPPFAAVVVIEGSTTEGRTLWTYRSIGDLFARNGIAALVYDKRGVGQSDGNIDSVTFEDLAKDVDNAIGYLISRQDIDSGSIGLFGISQGGWVAPLVASRSDNVSFAILLAGPTVSIWQQELHRVEYSMRAGIYGEDKPDVFSEEDIAAALAHTRLGFTVAQNPEEWDKWKASIINARAASWAEYVILDSTLDDLQGWLRFKYDPEEALQNMRVPVLALFGENDVFVPPAENVPLLKSFFAGAGNNKSRIVVYPDAGHDFFTGATLVNGAWQWPTGFWRWNRRTVGLADTIITWTHRQLK